MGVWGSHHARQEPQLLAEWTAVRRWISDQHPQRCAKHGHQLEAGALEAAYGPPLNDVVRLKQDPSFQALVNPQLGQFFYVNQNVTLPLFQNKLVRQAMNFALNRQRISLTVLQNLCGDPICLPWPQQSPAYEAEKNATYTFDLNKAAALLKQAGASNASLAIS
jgi:peptide/nickel transport system substrate-binding protein